MFLIDDAFRVTVCRMELIEAEFSDGVLRPMHTLALRPGERVGIVVVRRPDPLRWDLARLSKVTSEEDSLSEAGLADWETSLGSELKRATTH
jgi:predicted DNA-binding antitoxin AbrB/MazE fold protein